MRTFKIASAPASVVARAMPGHGAVADRKGALGTVSSPWQPALSADPLRWMWTLLLTWQSRFETRRQLASLDARMLRDIGLREDDVSQEISKPFWRS